MKDTLTKIRNASKTYDNTKAVDCTGMLVGQWAAQGDVQVEKIDPPACHGEPWATQQVVEGTTKGSRHVFDERARLFHQAKEDSELEGPLCFIDDEAVLIHPEHRHMNFGAGCYRITYQRDMRMEEIRRVRD